MQKHQSEIKEGSTTALSYQELMVASPSPGTNLNQRPSPDAGPDDIRDVETMY